MNKKIAIASVLLGVFIIGIVTAGLVGYLSNVVTASVKVEGPVFYATLENKLLMNEFDDSTGTYEIIDGENEIFLTTKFNESIDFYKPSLDMYVEAKVISGEIPKELELEFGYFTSSGSFKKICEGTVSIISNTSFDSYNVEDCTGTSELSDVNGFYYRITGMATPDVTCAISIDNGNTRAEIDKA
jgi:hypothetical protein